MANPVSTLQVLRDGARNYVVKATFISGGLDQPLTTIVNCATANPPFGIHGKITRVDYDIIPGGLVRLSWEAPPTHTDILDLGGFDHKSFKFQGGLMNNGGGSATGNVLINTQGFTSGYQYTVIIEMVKCV